MQGVVLGLLLFPILFKYVLQIWEYIASSGHSDEKACNGIGKCIIFYTSLTFILVVIAPSWMQFVLDFHSHPLLWYLLPLHFILLWNIYLFWMHFNFHHFFWSEIFFVFINGFHSFHIEMGDDGCISTGVNILQCMWCLVWLQK